MRSPTTAADIEAEIRPAIARLQDAFGSAVTTPGANAVVCPGRAFYVDQWRGVVLLSGPADHAWELREGRWLRDARDLSGRLELALYLGRARFLSVTAAFDEILTLVRNIALHLNMTEFLNLFVVEAWHDARRGRVVWLHFARHASEPRFNLFEGLPPTSTDFDPLFAELPAKLEPDARKMLPGAVTPRAASWAEYGVQLLAEAVPAAVASTALADDSARWAFFDTHQDEIDAYVRSQVFQRLADMINAERWRYFKGEPAPPISVPSDDVDRPAQPTTSEAAIANLARLRLNQPWGWDAVVGNVDAAMLTEFEGRVTEILAAARRSFNRAYAGADTDADMAVNGIRCRVDQLRGLLLAAPDPRYPDDLAQWAQAWAVRGGKAYISTATFAGQEVLREVISGVPSDTGRRLALLVEGERSDSVELQLLVAEVARQPDIELDIWAWLAIAGCRAPELPDDCYVPFQDGPKLISDYDSLFAELPSSGGNGLRPALLPVKRERPMWRMRALYLIAPDLEREIVATSDDAERNALFTAHRDRIWQYVRHRLFIRGTAEWLDDQK